MGDRCKTGIYGQYSFRVSRSPPHGPHARVYRRLTGTVRVWRPLEGAPLAWLTSVVRVPSRHNEAIGAFTAAVSESLAEAGHHVADTAPRA